MFWDVFLDPPDKRCSDVQVKIYKSGGNLYGPNRRFPRLFVNVVNREGNFSNKKIVLTGIGE